MKMQTSSQQVIVLFNSIGPGHVTKSKNLTGCPEIATKISVKSTIF